MAMNKRTFLLCLATAAFKPMLGTALGKEGGDHGGEDHGGDDHGGNKGPGGGDDGPNDRRRGDQRPARALSGEGKRASLKDIIALVLGEYGGEVVDVRLVRAQGSVRYRLKCVDASGRLLEVEVDPLTRRIKELRGF